VRNEAQFIEAALQSLLQQYCPDFDLEVLVVDGMSSDGTAEIVTRIAKFDSRVKLLTNDRKNTPFAFNIGLKEAQGEFVGIFGAHTSYRWDYISVCLNELREHDVIGCSGQINTHPANDSVQAKLVAWSLSHWFGSSTRSVRTQPDGFRDAVPYPIMKKHALLAVGGYDEQLNRNQDNDMNQKLRSRGYRLYVTSETQCEYFVKPTVWSLLQYAFRAGYWNVISFRKNRASMRLRHFVPFVFVVALLCASTAAAAMPFVLSRYQKWLLVPFFLISCSHLLIGLFAGIQVAVREKSLAALMLPLVFVGFHISYGSGTLWGVLQNAQSAPLVPPRVREPFMWQT
jgi:glycosyltransferase involved in cell wall biosynthesis